MKKSAGRQRAIEFYRSPLFNPDNAKKNAVQFSPTGGLE